MTPPTPSLRYCAYLLRCWQATSRPADDAHGWRFSLEDPSTGARHSFASFDSLIAFLHDTLMAPCRSIDVPVDEQIDHSREQDN